MSDLVPMRDLEKIREECRGSISSYAVAGAVNAVNPIPGIDAGIDAGICLKMMLEIRESFGLDEKAAKKLRKYDILLPLVKKVFDYATKEGVMILLKSVGKRYLGKTAAKYVPLVGQGIAAAAGYGMMKYFGNSYIDDCYELAKQMQQYDIEGSYREMDSDDEK